MSIKEVELVRRWFDAYGRGDRPSALSCVGDRFRITEGGEVSDLDRYRGARGLELWLLDERRFSPDLAPDHFLEVGDRVVALCRDWGLEQGSETLVERRFALSLSVERVRIIGLEYFPRWEDALIPPP